MRIFVLFFLLFVSSAGVAMADGNVSKFAFTSREQTISSGEISQKITIQSQDSAGNQADLPQTGCLKLETSSATGEFSSSATSWQAVSNLTMNKGTANRNFYYKDSSAGNHVLTIKSALVSCASWTVESWTVVQNIIVSASSESTSSFSSSSEQSSSSISSQASSQGESAPTSGSVSIWPTEPQIFANAGSDKTAIAGADVLFEGKALGIKKEPLDGARYYWNFGDGSSAEGQNVRHSYKYPGTHIAVLDVSSGQYSVSDRLNVKVVPNELHIVDVNTEFIKLKNKSNIILDVSGWFLMGNSAVFKFPASSFVGAGAELIISSDVSKIKFLEGVNIDLLYSNGSTAFSYKKEIKVSPKPTTVVGFGDGGVASQNKNVPAGVSAKTTTPSSRSNSFGSSSSENLSVASSSPNVQTANVIYSAKPENSDWKTWLYLALGLGVFGGGGLFFIRRNSGV